MKIFRHFKILTNRFVYKEGGPSYQYEPDLAGVEAGAKKEMSDLQKGIEDKIDEIGADPTGKVATEIADEAIKNIDGVSSKLEQQYRPHGDPDVRDSKVYVDRITMHQVLKAEATKVKGAIENAKAQYIEREKSLEAAATAEGIFNVVAGNEADIYTRIQEMDQITNFKVFESLDDLGEDGDFRLRLTQLNNLRDLFVPTAQGYAQCADIIKDMADPAIKAKYSKLMTDIEAKNKEYTELMNVKFPKAYNELLAKGKVQIQKAVKDRQDEIKRLKGESSKLWTKVNALESQGKMAEAGQLRTEAAAATQELNDFTYEVQVKEFENFQRRLAKVPPMEGSGGAAEKEEAPIRVAKNEKAPDAETPDTGKKG